MIESPVSLSKKPQNEQVMVETILEEERGTAPSNSGHQFR